jgi:ACR3 family arsenite efflux pump ArsB
MNISMRIMVSCKYEGGKTVSQQDKGTTALKYPSGAAYDILLFFMTQLTVFTPKFISLIIVFIFSIIYTIAYFNITWFFNNLTKVRYFEHTVMPSFIYFICIVYFHR